MQADVLTAYGWLVQRQRDLAVSGESSGGNLALNLALALKAQGMVQPEALHLVSPFVDLTLTASSITANKNSEAWLTRQRLIMMAGAFIQDGNPDDPSVSPVNGDLAGLAPIHIVAAADEALADDAHRLYRVARAAGVEASLRMVADSVHGFALFDDLPETQSFLTSVRDHARAIA